MAYDNNDVLLVPDGREFNINTLYIFIGNVDKDIKICIHITTFGLDGPAHTSILSYDGNAITLYADSSRFSEIPNDIQVYSFTGITSEIIINLDLQYKTFMV